MTPRQPGGAAHARRSARSPRATSPARSPTSRPPTRELEYRLLNDGIFKLYNRLQWAHALELAGDRAGAERLVREVAAVNQAMAGRYAGLPAPGRRRRHARRRAGSGCRNGARRGTRFHAGGRYGTSLAPRHCDAGHPGAPRTDPGRSDRCASRDPCSSDSAASPSARCWAPG